MSVSFRLSIHSYEIYFHVVSKGCSLHLITHVWCFLCACFVHNPCLHTDSKCASAIYCSGWPITFYFSKAKKSMFPGSACSSTVWETLNYTIFPSYFHKLDQYITQSEQWFTSDFREYKTLCASLRLWFLSLLLLYPPCQPLVFCSHVVGLTKLLSVWQQAKTEDLSEGDKQRAKYGILLHISFCKRIPKRLLHSVPGQKKNEILFSFFKIKKLASWLSVWHSHCHKGAHLL